MTDGVTVVRRRRADAARPPAAPTRPDAAWPRPATALFWVAVVVLVGVVVLAGARTSGSGWLATGDDAFLVMRSRHVLGGDPPLLSTASSAGADSAQGFNHPGPMLLYLTAPLVAVLGTGAMPLAVSLVDGAAVALVALLAHRNARPVPAATLLTATALLVWSMGSGVLTDVWNPHAAMLPFLLAAAAAWAVLQGDRVAVPIGVAAVSLTAQTHLSFAAMCLPLALVVVAVPAIRAVRARSAGVPEASRSWARALAVGGIVGVVSLLPPLVEQVGGGSEGNMARILRGAGDQGAGVGVRQAVAFLADTLAVPPLFLRGSWEGPLVPATTLSGAGLAAAVAAAGIALGATAVAAQRRGDRQVRDLVAVVALLVAAGVVVAAALPPLAGGFRLSSARWAWPLAALAWAAVLARPLERLGEAWSPAMVQAGLCGIAGVAALATVPVANADLSGSLPRDRAVLDDLWQQAGGRLASLGSVEIRSGGTRAQLVVVPGLANALDEAGVRIGLRDPVQVQQAGDWARSTGGEEWSLLTLPAGDAPPAGAILVARHRPDGAARRRAGVERLAASIDAEDLRPGPDAGGAGAGAGRIVEPFAEQWREDPVATLGSDAFATWLAAGMIEVRGQATDEVLRTARDAATLQQDAVDLWLVRP
jgi:hypothetical protein